MPDEPNPTYVERHKRASARFAAMIQCAAGALGRDPLLLEAEALESGCLAVCTACRAVREKRRGERN